MGNQKRTRVGEKLHQHIDGGGVKFGHWHPVDATHKKEQTQKAHDLTISKEE